MNPFPAGDALFDEARELMNRMLDGELSADDMARLERLVCEREDVRRYYVLHNHLWCNLAPLFTAARATGGRDEHLDTEESMVLSVTTPTTTTSPAAGTAFFDEDGDQPDAIELPPLVWPEPLEPEHPWRLKLWVAGSVAATLLLAATLAAVLWPRAVTPPVAKKAPATPRIAVTQPVEVPTSTQPTAVVVNVPPAPPPPPSPPPKPVITATLNATVRGEWAEPFASLAVGQKLPTEPVELKAGFAEVKFANGVSVILEAPARLHVRSDMQVELSRGKLVATVGERGSGFVVDTASARLVDLGTEFGVNVDDAGATQVEVFQGKVQAKPPAAPETTATTAPAPAPKFETKELVAGQAARVEAKSATVAEVKPSPLAFVRNEEFTVRRESEAGSDYHRWLAYTYEIRRDPSLAAFYTFDKPQGPARGVSNRADLTAGKFDLPLGYANIPASRPQWAKGRWPEKGALDFNPKVPTGSFIPSFPFSTNQRLTVAAWVYARGNANWAAVAKNRGDDKEGAGQFSLALYENDGTVVGRVTQADGKEVLAREPKGSPMPLNQWVHVAMVADGATLRVYRDGREVGSVPCTGPTPAPTPTWLAIGYRAGASQRPAKTNRGEPWDGLIDELVIFHRGLSGEEIRQMYEAGRPGA